MVGVVHNAVDDHLDGSDQLHHSWSLDDLKILRPILRESRDSGRTVILTSDHGHVLDDGTTLRSSQGGDRWRPPTGSVADDECEIGAGRVIGPNGDHIVVMPWSEKVRYASRKNGYHGGATPQEVVVPLCVYSTSPCLEGWRVAPPTAPQWWQEAADRRQVSRTAPPIPQTAEVKQIGDELPLFKKVAPARRNAVEWLAELFLSSAYKEQKTLAARGAPGDDDVRRVLEALQSRGGKLSRMALAQKAGVSMLRLPGLLSAVKRVVNIDQSPILRVDASADTVELNVELLIRQFGLESKP